jgi:hypothetical protein
MAEVATLRIGRKKNPKATHIPRVDWAISSPYLPVNPQIPGNPMKIKDKIDAARLTVKARAGRFKLLRFRGTTRILAPLERI